MPDGAEPRKLPDDARDVVAPVEPYLARLQAMHRSPTTARTHAISLKVCFELPGKLAVRFDAA
jgi:hypothetical protein